jgi:hypothetical protein
MSNPAARPNLTISDMMAGVVLAATVFAASAGVPNPPLLAGVILLCLFVMGLLAVSVLGVIYRRGERRAFWLGFALFGWPAFAWVLYLLSYSPPHPDSIIPALLVAVVPYAWIGGSVARKFVARGSSLPTIRPEAFDAALAEFEKPRQSAESSTFSVLPLAFLACLPAGLETVPLEAPKYGLKVELPAAWRVAARERNEYIFVAEIRQADPDRPGAAACELGVAPENLDEYRTRIDGNARQGRRPGKLARNAIVPGVDGRPQRLESLWEYRPPDGPLWRELSVRVIANRQMYTFVLSVDEEAWETARPAFDALVDSAHFTPPNTGADLVDQASNRWVQREFKFALELPEGWSPVLAPDEVALLFASGPAHGIWSDNALVIANPQGKPAADLERLARELPDRLRAEEPGCEVLSCSVIRQDGRDALETVVRTRRGPFSMTVLERRFRGARFDYETKFTVESKRFEELAPVLRKSLDSFREVPGEVPGAAGKPA